MTNAIHVLTHLTEQEVAVTGPQEARAFLRGLKKQDKKKETIKVKFVDSSSSSSLCRTYTLESFRSRQSTYKIVIGNRPSPWCDCDDYLKYNGKEICKHILWTLLYICKLPENSDIMHQLYLTDEEVSSVLGN